MLVYDQGVLRLQKLQKSGLEVKDMDAAVAWADVIMVLLPDQNQKKVYDEQIVPHLKDGDTLGFCPWFQYPL